MRPNIVTSFPSFANGLKSWLDSKNRWSHLYDKSWRPLARWLEDLQQACKFSSALTNLILQKPQLGDALRKDYDKVAELAARIDKLIENSLDLQRWPSICKAMYGSQVPEWLAPDVEGFECKLAEFQATIASITDVIKTHELNRAQASNNDNIVLLELPTKRVSLAKAAKWFKCDYRTLKKDIESGKIKARRISARRWEFDLDQVTEFNPSVRPDADPTEVANT